MKFTVNREEFVKQLYAAQNVAESKGAIQILGYALIHAKDNQVTIRATDLDLSITSSLEANVAEEGSILLNSRTLYETVKKGINAEVLLESNEQHHCHLNTGTDYELVGLDASEFPELPEATDSKMITINKDLFSDAIKGTIYAASDSEARAALNGLYFEPRESGLRLVATDGHRLALTDIQTEDAFPTAEGVILARKGISEVIKSIPTNEENIQIGIFERFACFEWTNVRCTLRLVNADFPAYDQVIPQNLNNSVVVDRQVFLDSIGRVSTVSNERFSSLKLHFEQGEPGTIELSCNNFEQGESKDLLQIDYAGEQVDIGFNIKYIQAAISSFKIDEIKISFRDQLSAATITAPNSDDIIAVIMPLRI